MREVPGSTPGQAPFSRPYFSLFFFFVLFVCLCVLLFFFRLASNGFPDFGSVARIEKKKLKKNHKKDDVKNTQYTVETCSCLSLFCYYAHFSD